MDVNKVCISMLLALGLFATGCSNGKNTDQNATNQNASPVVELIGAKTIEIIAGETFEDPGAKAYDNEDGNLTAELIHGEVNTTQPGRYVLVYCATDQAGNRSTIERTVIVKRPTPLSAVAPIDSNIELGNEKGVLYYADPRPEENGLNRALRVDYINWNYEAIDVDGINPHSIDRAGNTDRFYIRTQNSYSFDVVNFKEKSVKTVDMGAHKPRAIGAYNDKYKLQLISVLNRPVIDVIDVTKDEIIATVGDDRDYNKTKLTSNAGAGSATGHAFWLDPDHFGLIDRVHSRVCVFKVEEKEDGEFEFSRTDAIELPTALHSIERVRYPLLIDDLKLFYGTGEGDITKGIVAYVQEFVFDSKSGKLEIKRKVDLNASTEIIDKIKPTTHHAGVSPDGKYFVVPVYDKKVYFVNRKTMKIDKVIEADLGAAHVEFSKRYGIAVITNHFSENITIIDYKNLELIGHLKISDHTFDPNDKHLMQPHFSYIAEIEGEEYFLTFDTQAGEFLKIPLGKIKDKDALESFDTNEIERLKTGGAPEQAHS